MAVTVKKVLSREAFKSLEIETNGSEPEFVQIAGIETLTLSFEADEDDTTDYDSEGWAEHLIGERSEQVEISGKMAFVDAKAETPERDPGQKAVEELGRKTGIESLGKVRLNTLGGGTITYVCSAQLGNQGGARAAASEWGASFQSSGKPEITPAGANGGEG